ncbi:hypothetical protein ABW21_db0201994 [Orbilia brochopaga]|nr:hypothetical protein ABW21_db0201994 [Drechslerella brochopaga]
MGVVPAQRVRMIYLSSVKFLLCWQLWIAQPIEAKPIHEAVSTSGMTTTSLYPVSTVSSLHTDTFGADPLLRPVGTGSLDAVTPRPLGTSTNRHAHIKRFIEKSTIICVSAWDAVYKMDPDPNHYPWVFERFDEDELDGPGRPPDSDEIPSPRWNMDAAWKFPGSTNPRDRERLTGLFQRIQDQLDMCYKCRCDDTGAMVVNLNPPVPGTEDDCRNWSDIKICEAWLDCYCTIEPRETQEPLSLEEVKEEIRLDLDVLHGQRPYRRIFFHDELKAVISEQTGDRSDEQPWPGHPRRVQAEGTKEPYYLEGKTPLSRLFASIAWSVDWDAGSRKFLEYGIGALRGVRNIINHVNKYNRLRGGKRSRARGRKHLKRGRESSSVASPRGEDGKELFPLAGQCDEEHSAAGC